MKTIPHKKLALSRPLPETHAFDETLETYEKIIKIDVLWGEDSLLHSDSISTDETYAVGEGESGPTSFLIGKKALGLKELPLVAQRNGQPHVLVPRGAQATLFVPADAQVGRPLRPESGTVQQQPFGATLHALETDARVEVAHRAFVFRISTAQAGLPARRDDPIEKAPLLYIAGAGLFMLLLLLAFAAFVPPSSGLNVTSLDERTLLTEYVLDVQEAKNQPMPDWMVGALAEAAGKEGKASAGDEGAAGKETAPKEKKRLAIEGPKDNKTPEVPREHAAEQAKHAGILGALAALQLTSDGPTSPFAKVHAQGADDIAAVGTLLGEVGNSFGFNGLGMNGTGRLGGGDGEGTIGVGNHNTIGSIGRGRGCDSAGPCDGGYGRVGLLGDPGRKSGVPTLRPGPVTVAGSLSKEAIRRAVRRHHNEVRHCYEKQLKNRPDLSGRVSVKFVIAPTGAVQSSIVASSSLGDAEVEQCISSAVRRWGFPEPDNGGVVAVTYPFMLSAN